MSDLTILHTNDLHGKLTDAAAGRIVQEKASCRSCILLDAGDAVSSGNIYFRPGGEPILARMSEIGYDAMAMGNREFHFLSPGLKSKLRLAAFPVLSANLRSKNSALGPSVSPSITLTRNGLKVAVFGLTVPMITKRMLASKASPFWFDDPISAAQEIVPDLRAEADIVIALTHIGLRLDQELARSVSGIDMVIGGHSHAVLSETQYVDSTAIVQAGSWGRFLGKIDVTLPDEGGHPSVSSTLIDLRDG